MQTVTYGVALIETPLDEGLTKDEALMLFEKIHGIKAIPITKPEHTPLQRP